MIYFVSRASEIFEENEVYKCISVEESLKILDTINIVGLDTETEGFDPYTKKLLSLQLVILYSLTIDYLFSFDNWHFFLVLNFDRSHKYHEE